MRLAIPGNTASLSDKPQAGWQAGDALDLAAGIVAIALIALAFAGESGLPRVLLALAFAFFVPGRAIVTNWPWIARWSEATMSMVLSLVVLTLLATTSLWVHSWHPLVLFQVEAWLSLAGLSVGVARRHGVPTAHRGWPRRPGRSARLTRPEAESPPGDGQAVQS